METVAYWTLFALCGVAIYFLWIKEFVDRSIKKRRLRIYSERIQKQKQALEQRVKRVAMDTGLSESLLWSVTVDYKPVKPGDRRSRSSARKRLYYLCRL